MNVNDFSALREEERLDHKNDNKSSHLTLNALSIPRFNVYMMVRDKRDINPVLLKFGAALAVSIAGFLLSRLKTNKNKSSQPPHSPRSPGLLSLSTDWSGFGFCLPLDNSVRERAWRRDDLQVTNRTSSSGSLTSISTEIHVFSPSSRQSGDKDGYLLPEFIDLVKELTLMLITLGRLLTKMKHQGQMWKLPDQSKAQKRSIMSKR
uniref:Transmembrane protein n=1 Tax=Salix viminalis TaxID=40686 RepID=A0A6N2KDW5_SALVM